MSQIYDLAATYVDRWAALDPIGATDLGIPGHDREMTDYSPAGHAARAALDRETLTALPAVPVAGDRDRIARECLAEFLTLRLDQHGAGEHLRELRVLASPLQSVRGCFDLMARDSRSDWETIAIRLARVPAALAGYQESLREGLARGLAAARRQALAGAKQAEVWSGQQSGTPPFFQSLVSGYDESNVGDAVLRSRLVAAVGEATAAYAEMGRFLREDYAPRAIEADAVGGDRYALAARQFNGIDLDLAETYAWGWDEFRRIEREMAATADHIRPGVSVDEVMRLLNEDPARAIDGVEPFRQWMQDFQDRTIAELHGVHFDIPEPVRRIEAMIAPPGGTLAMYYTGPSEDFSRPGRTWYPTGGKSRFPLWDEVTVAYHEGVPGHHLQVGQTVYLAEELSRFQRTLGWTSGHGEGWALYTERLMAELGYLENPDYYLGLLRSQAMRGARVIVDIGLHLQLPIPTDETFHPGEVWTPELALAFMTGRARVPADFAASEVDRYLGWPGQAISYKVGERVWLAVRADARARHGAGFSLKDFHARALDLGPMGLAQMRREMARI